jgi:pectate lyase
MKNSLVIFVFFCIANVFAQNYYMATPQGFGANATGGGSATPVTVSDFTQLKAALPSTSTNKVILISGTIDCSYWSVLMTNVSIIGLPGARLRNLQITVGNSTASAAQSGILYIKPGSNNVIIRNLIFEGPGAYDVDGRDNLTNEGTNVWVDHCEFQDAMDGNFDNKGMCDKTTISWCKFTYLKPAIAGGSGGSNDHRFSNLVGSSATDFPTDGHYSITFQNCYWATGCKERMPRARNAELHLLNCYYNVGTTSSKAIGLGGGNNNTTCYVEKCNFANVSTVYGSYISTDGGTVAINYSNCASTYTNIGTVTPPTYITTSMPVADVANYLTDATCGAGATLQVTSTGVISPNNCAFLGTNTNNFSEKSYITSINNNILNIKFNTTIPNEINYEIFSISGELLKSNCYKIINSSSTIEVNLEEFSKGIYFINFKFKDKIFNEKFIKY